MASGFAAFSLEGYRKLPSWESRVGGPAHVRTASRQIKRLRDRFVAPSILGRASILYFNSLLTLAISAMPNAVSARGEESLPQECAGRVADFAITDFVIEERLPNPGTVAAFKWIVHYTNTGPNNSSGVYYYQLFDASDDRQVASRFRNAATVVGEERMRISNESEITMRPGSYYYARISYPCDPNEANNRSPSVIVERNPLLFINGFEP